MLTAIPNIRSGLVVLPFFAEKGTTVATVLSLLGT